MTAKAGGGDLWGGKEPVGGLSPLTQLPGCPSCQRLRPRPINGSVSLSGGGCLLRLKAAVAPLAPWGWVAAGRVAALQTTHPLPAFWLIRSPTPRPVRARISVASEKTW